MKNLSNFHYAMNLLNILYGITIQEDEFEEIALTGWNLIGNKRTRIYRYKAVVSDCEKGIKLPCNCDYIEAVTTNFETKYEGAHQSHRLPYVKLKASLNICRFYSLQYPKKPFFFGISANLVRYTVFMRCDFLPE